MSGNENERKAQEKISPHYLVKDEGVDSDPAVKNSRNSSSSSCGDCKNGTAWRQNRTTNRPECLNEGDNVDHIHKKQQRLPTSNWTKHKLLQLEQQIDEWKKNEQVFTSNNCDDTDVDWLHIVMDLDGHDVEANLRYVRRDSTEDPPTGVEPFSRPYHERRYSLAGAEEVF